LSVIDSKAGPSSTALELCTSSLFSGTVLACCRLLGNKLGEGMLPMFGDLTNLSTCVDPLVLLCIGISTAPSLAAAASAATLAEPIENELFLRFIRCMGLMLLSDAECRDFPLYEFLAGRL